MVPPWSAVTCRPLVIGKGPGVPGWRLLRASIFRNGPVRGGWWFRVDHCSGAAPWVKTVEEAVELVGDVGVIERGGMRVVPARWWRGRGGRGGPGPWAAAPGPGRWLRRGGGVQSRMLDPRGRRKAGEPVGEGVSGQAGRPPWRRAEQPVLLRLQPGRPGLDVAPDHVRCACTAGDPPGPARLGRAKEASGQTAFDGEGPAVQVPTAAAPLARPAVPRSRPLGERAIVIARQRTGAGRTPRNWAAG